MCRDYTKAIGRLASGRHDAQHTDARAGVLAAESGRDCAGQGTAALVGLSRLAQGTCRLVRGAHEQNRSEKRPRICQNLTRTHPAVLGRVLQQRQAQQGTFRANL